MAQDRLERCSNGCCFFVNGKIVTKEDFEQARAQHPGSYAGLGSGQRNAVLETVVACRSELNSTNYTKQSNRITQLVRQLNPSAVVVFDSTNVPNFIRFRIKTGDTELTKGYPHLPTNQVAGWTDEKLEQTIEAVTDRLVRRAS